ncbi:hypothetical protein AGMMS49545_02600 [Betaproteobacteria bacterium]|nr:hypothetical protein AGMMS49545_02600 [Betaproteobacteria bacterium]GHU40281.1 hypothetical protein AGMMS50289_01570 [Betaproteobacteria bacterium]
MSQAKSPFFFSIAKWISLAVATVALLGAVIALLYTLSSFGSGSFNTPRFGDEEVQKQVSLSLSEDDVQAQQEKLDISNKYGQRILSIVTKHGLRGEQKYGGGFGKITRGNKTDEMVEVLQKGIPKERRDDFINGWEKFLDEGMAYMTKNGRVAENTADKISDLYFAHFGEALQKVKSEENEAKTSRLPAIGAAIALSLLFVVAMVVPVLVGIERNTRAVAYGNVPVTPAPRPAPVVAAPVAAAVPPAPQTVCPKCAAPIAAGDTFCGECGAQLG